MLNNTPFYNQHVKNAIVAFGRVFSNIVLERKLESDPTKNQTIQVPLTYAPKEKWIVRIEQDPELTGQVHTVLPRMSFEITGMSYDSARKLNRMSKVLGSNPTIEARLDRFNSDASTNVSYTPVPYNVDVTLYILTKSQEDNLQILEQILPTFTPDYTISSDILPELGLTGDVPIVLNSVMTSDEYDGDFQTRRFVTTTLNFTVKVNLYGSSDKNALITKATTNVYDSFDIPELNYPDAIEWASGISVNAGDVILFDNYYQVENAPSPGDTLYLGEDPPIHHNGVVLNGTAELRFMYHKTSKHSYEGLATGGPNDMIIDSWLEDF